MTNTPDLATAAIKLIFSLGVVLLVVWGLYRISKGKLAIHPMGTRSKLIHILDNHYMGVKKNIALVKVPGSILVVGIGADNVNLLTEINDPDILKAIPPDSQKHHGLSFKEQLQRFTKSQSKDSNTTNHQNDETVT